MTTRNQRLEDEERKDEEFENPHIPENIIDRRLVALEYNSVRNWSYQKSAEKAGLTFGQFKW